MRWSRILWAAVLPAVATGLSVATLAGCAYDPGATDPGATPAARTQAQRASQVPGSMTIHMNGSVTSEFMAR